MQRGSLALVSRKEGPDVWQFRWSEKDLHEVRVQRKRMIGTVERYPDGAAARTAMTIVLAELNSEKARIGCSSITVAPLCDHFEQRELTRDNTWRSYGPSANSLPRIADQFVHAASNNSFRVADKPLVSPLPKEIAAFLLDCR